MHAEIVMIGTELLLGEIVDTNANRLAKALREIGLDLLYKTTVGDNESRITQVLNLALDRSDVVITSGGLGPTVDDVTRQAVANATGRRLVYSTELEAQIEARFRGFGRKMAENNKHQAYIPEGALTLPNPVGTAPCFLSEDVGGRGFIISLPGVPRELEYMMEHTDLPILIERMGGRKVMKVRVLRTCAVGESDVGRAIDDLMNSANPTVGLAAHAGQTDVRITAKADSTEEAETLIADMEAKVRDRLGVAVYGVEKETVAEVLGRLLTERDIKVGVIDTITLGQFARNLIEAGFGDRIADNLQPDGVMEAWEVADLEPPASHEQKDKDDRVISLAEKLAPKNGVGLAMLGPMDDRSTYIAVYGPGGFRLTKKGLNYRDQPYFRHWLVIQGMDWVRRVVLGELVSPVDWK
jgi:nicotinamide-nucleotide amidase